MTDVVMAEIHTSVCLLWPLRASPLGSQDQQDPCRSMPPGTQTRHIRLRSSELLAPSWRGSHCFGRAHLNAPERIANAH
jgi:hypothetical protein